MDIIFATSNKGKLREAREILEQAIAGEELNLLTPEDAGADSDVPETGETLAENSVLKAEAIFAACGGKDCFADDTGLEVDALGGAPGVHTARYAGEGHDFEANMDKLLAELERAGATTAEQRTARFKSVVTLIAGGQKHLFEGTLEGKIAFRKAGGGGFGYDPVFIPEELPLPGGGTRPNTEGLTLSQISEDDKNAISHRGKALRAMAAHLGSL